MQRIWAVWRETEGLIGQGGQENRKRVFRFGTPGKLQCECLQPSPTADIILMNFSCSSSWKINKHYTPAPNELPG